MRKTLESILKTLDFTELETKIFIKLLELNEATASLLGKELKVHRRSVYDAVERLVDKGIVGFIEKDGKKYYQAIPDKLLDIIKEKKENIEEIEKKYIDILRNIYLTKQEARAVILYGKEGIKRIYLDELKEGKTVYVICTDIEKTENLLGNIFLTRFTRERIKKKIWIYMITSKESKKFLKKYKFIKIRYFPFDFITPASFSSYGNKLNITLWSDEPIVFSVENKEIANSFRKYFELLWKICEK